MPNIERNCYKFTKKRIEIDCLWSIYCAARRKRRLFSLPMALRMELTVKLLLIMQIIHKLSTYASTFHHKNIYFQTQIRMPSLEKASCVNARTLVNRG